MPRLVNKATGAVVNVSDEKAKQLGTGWASPDGKAAERSETPDKTWKVDELKAYAAEHEIDLGEATKKDEIIAAISASEES